MHACNVLHFCAALNLSFLTFFFRFFRFGASTAISATGAALSVGHLGWRGTRQGGCHTVAAIRVLIVVVVVVLGPIFDPVVRLQRSKLLALDLSPGRSVKDSDLGTGGPHAACRGYNTAQGWSTALRQRDIGARGRLLERLRPASSIDMRSSRAAPLPARSCTANQPLFTLPETVPAPFQRTRVARFRE